MSSRASAVQPRLGQVHTAEGPLDLSAVYVIHHALRRDVRDFLLAVPVTGTDRRDVWGALERRWSNLTTALGHHCRVEDDQMWPAIRMALGEDDSDSRALLDAMTLAHNDVKAKFDLVRRSFESMLSVPSSAVRTQLLGRLEDASEALLAHLAQEEAEALPLMQSHVSVDQWKLAQRAAGKEYGVADLRFAVPWSAHEIPVDQFAIAFAHGGRLVRLLLMLTQRRFRREHRAAFGELRAAHG